MGETYCEIKFNVIRFSSERPKSKQPRCPINTDLLVQTCSHTCLFFNSDSDFSSTLVSLVMFFSSISRTRLIKWEREMKGEGKVFLKSRMKWIGLLGLVLSVFSLIVHFLLAGFTDDSISDYSIPITIFSWRPVFDNPRFARHVYISLSLFPFIWFHSV